jgi:hypothetical protein
MPSLVRGAPPPTHRPAETTAFVRAALDGADFSGLGSGARTVVHDSYRNVDELDLEAAGPDDRPPMARRGHVAGEV